MPFRMLRQIGQAAFLFLASLGRIAFSLYLPFVGQLNRHIMASKLAGKLLILVIIPYLLLG